MQKRPILLITLFLFLMHGMCTQSMSNPNTIIILADDLGFAVCEPSIAGLITSRYQDRFGFCRNPLFAPKDINQGLPLSEETIAEALEKKGNKNMAVGKWHLDTY